MKKLLLLLVTALFLNVCILWAQPSSPLLENPPKETDVLIVPAVLNWSDVSGADCYYVQIVTDTLLAFPEPVCMSSTSQLNITTADVDPDTKYYWRVFAHNSSGWGAPSGYYSFTTADASTAGTIQNLTDGVIDLIADHAISGNQGNILINRLQQTQAAINRGQKIVALVHMAAFKTRIILLRISGLITQSVFDNLNFSSDGVIDLIADLDNSNNTQTTENNPLLTPDKYSLLQNYPNPFNPVTTIEYSIPQGSFVSIKVYDMLGREVADLVNKYQETGTYITEWNASALSSGVYFYTIRSGNFTDTKKMILSK